MLRSLKCEKSYIIENILGKKRSVDWARHHFVYEKK